MGGMNPSARWIFWSRGLRRGASACLRVNENFLQSLEDKCHRMLNAVEPGTVVPIHRHPTKDESFVILRGKVRGC